MLDFLDVATAAPTRIHLADKRISCVVYLGMIQAKHEKLAGKKSPISDEFCHFFIFLNKNVNINTAKMKKVWYTKLSSERVLEK